MPIVLLIAFNGFVLFLVLSLFLGFSHHPGHYEQGLYALISFGIVCGLAFLVDSAAGQWVLRLLSGARAAIGREQARIDPIIAQVQERITGQLGLPPIAVRLMVMDDPLPNAFAVGKGTLILSRTLYETADDDELAAVIAHEFGHLHNGDSHRLGVALGVSLVSLSIAAVAGVITRFCGGMARNVGAVGMKDEGVVIFISSMFFGLLAGFFRVVVKIGNGVLRLINLFVGRKEEFEADTFAVKAGYGAGLLSFLDKIKNMHFGKPVTMLDRLYATHPAIMLRIGELEKNMEEIA